MLSKNTIFTSEQVQSIHKIFEYLAGAFGEDSSNLVAEAEELLPLVARISNHPSRGIRDYASHIRSRIGEFLNTIE